MKKNQLTLLLFCSILSPFTYAQTVYSDQYQRIQSVEFVEVIENENGEEVEVKIGHQKMDGALEAMIRASKPIKSDLSGVIMATRELIALGKEVYEIIKAGRPVTNVASEPIEVLPKDDSGEVVAAFDLTDWKKPIAKKYRVKTQNYLGMSPATFEFMIIFTYGGKLDGKGAYITGAQIKPTLVDVKWGYELNANFKVQTIMNQGKKDNPIAAAVLMIDYKISTVLQERSSSKMFHINGLGAMSAY